MQEPARLERRKRRVMVRRAGATAFLALVVACAGGTGPAPDRGEPIADDELCRRSNPCGPVDVAACSQSFSGRCGELRRAYIRCRAWNARCICGDPCVDGQVDLESVAPCRGDLAALDACEKTS